MSAKNNPKIEASEKAYLLTETQPAVMQPSARRDDYRHVQNSVPGMCLLLRSLFKHRIVDDEMRSISFSALPYLQQIKIRQYVIPERHIVIGCYLLK